MFISLKFWNEEIVDAINGLIDGAPEGCPKPAKLERLEPGEILTKSDVLDVCGTLEEICDENDFGEISLLTQSLFDEIAEAIGSGYCGCASFVVTATFGNSEVETAQIIIEVDDVTVTGDTSETLISISVTVGGELVLSLSRNPLTGEYVSALPPDSLSDEDRAEISAMLTEAGITFDIPAGV